MPTTPSSIDVILDREPPTSIAEARQFWPTRPSCYRQSTEWRDAVVYFLLVDRFSDEASAASDNLLRPYKKDGTPALEVIKKARAQWLARNQKPWFSWSDWATSGTRFQGGTLKGVEARLPYLKELGVDTIWLSPVFRQRAGSDDYHGYGIQHFFDVDARFGSRRDLVNLIQVAHAQYDLRVILDIVFNHGASAWLYDLAEADDANRPRYRPFDAAKNCYNRILPRSAFGTIVSETTAATLDYIYPTDLRGADRYVRAGKGALDAGLLDDDFAEHKRSDFENLRKFNLYWDQVLANLLLVYKYWIGLTDCDGFRLDTVRHVTLEQARNFCNGLKEHAETLGKREFVLLGELIGDDVQARYLQAVGRGLDSTLDLGGQKGVLRAVAKGLRDPKQYFDGFDWKREMGSHRNWGSRSAEMIPGDDHDNVSVPKERFSAGTHLCYQVATAAAIQLFTLGVPCIYYGSEVALTGGPEESERKQWLPDWGASDKFLREAMFGPEHPRAAGLAGWDSVGSKKLDQALPGFGPFGTAGCHVFDTAHPAFVRISRMVKVRKAFKALRRGRQYQRQTAFLNNPFAFQGAGELLAWSRIFDEQEVVVAVNTHDGAARGSRIIVDAALSPPGSTMDVVCYTGDIGAAGADRLEGKKLTVRPQGPLAYVDLGDLVRGGTLQPCEVIVLANGKSMTAAGAEKPGT